MISSSHVVGPFLQGSSSLLAHAAEPAVRSILVAGAAALVLGALRVKSDTPSGKSCSAVRSRCPFSAGFSPRFHFRSQLQNLLASRNLLRPRPAACLMLRLSRSRG